MHQWHWISSAVCLVCLVLFSVTGITLNHAGAIAADPVVTTCEVELSPSARAALAGMPEEGAAPLPSRVREWLRANCGVSVARTAAAESGPHEVYLALPEPGGDAWLAIDRATGGVLYEHTDRGWIAWLNDLHKGRNTGVVWRWFIDVFAVAALVFAATGLGLLLLHSRHRPSTWPVTLAGLILPWLLLMLFVH
ncbi:PepSY-associated TM helix family protein [Salinisphaera sp. PC39]